MRILRRKQERESIRGSALIGLYGAEGVESVHIVWAGDEAAFHFLVPAYLDKILFNLGRMPDEQQALLGRVEDFISSARDKLDRYENGLFASAGIAPLVADPPPGRPFAEIEVEVAFLEEAGRAGATTNFKPMQAANEKVAELGLWEALGPVRRGQQWRGRGRVLARRAGSTMRPLPSKWDADAREPRSCAVHRVDRNARGGPDKG